MALTLSTQRASASFVSNESAPRWKYDVFLSFRGVDTRKGFVSHLYHELWVRQGIMTFFDNRELEGGTSIPLELPSVIKESHIAIIVLSPNYVSSKWCLDELTTILQCMEGRKSVLPVFYEIDPSDVGNQRGCFAKAFTEHEEKFNTTEDKKKLNQWRADLKKVSKFSGWLLKNFKSERELIDDIVKCVQRKVQATLTQLEVSLLLLCQKSKQLTCYHRLNRVIPTTITTIHDLQQPFLPMALSTQRASASFLSNESTPPWEYDVFLSFRGVDTRKGFVSHLYGELCKWQGIRTFFDDRELEGGSSIGRELPSAIEKSHTAIVVLSPKYASSKWCLKELTTILQCMEARQSVLPVFYETDPSDVGNQWVCFAEAFAEHERNLISTEDKKNVVQWKADLQRVSKITGKHMKNFKCDRELIDDIVKWVWMKVQATFTLSDSSRKLVGTDYAFEQLSLLLAHDANDVCFIGITGMGGMGKTTLAKLVYDKICPHFEVRCFLANVREVCAKNGIVDLAKKLLFPFLRERITEIWDEELVSILIEKFLHNKKVLLVLDDVDRLKQLEVFAGNRGWFGMGSRIIVTTRNQLLLVQHGIETSYKVQGLNDAEALEFFSLHAFKKDQPEEDFLELSKYFINHAGGLPLALETLGSTLFERGLDAWNSERDSLSNIPNPTIFDKLKISYDGLEEWEKCIFLDVACFHKGKYIEQVIEILDNCFGMSSRIVIDGLIERSLLYQDHQNCIWMHDLIQEMAWKIVHDESEEPRLRSRLWLDEDIYHILKTNTGTRAIEAISLPLPKVEEVSQWNSEAFSKLDGLRFLEFGNLIISSDPKFLPCSLRTINWSFYPSKFLPTSFQPRFLTELKMRGSKLVRLWEGKKDLPNLKYIDLSNSNKLISTPDISGLSKLEILDLANCKNLVEIHPSVAVLKKLKCLRLAGCESIKNLPSEVEMDSLEVFILGGCSNVKKIPEFGEQMKNLSWIDLGGTTIEEIPSSIGHLVGLKELDLCDCKNLKKIPEFGEQMKNVSRIDLSGTAIEDIPSGHLVSLKQLHLGNCKNLLNLPMASYSLKSLERLVFDESDEGSDAKARDGCGLLRCLGLEKSRPNPPCRGVLLSSLNRLCSAVLFSKRVWCCPNPR